MIICKQPQIGGEVPEHNDSTFLYTDPPTALGFWIPLEACTPENGAACTFNVFLSWLLTFVKALLPSGFSQNIPDH
jgi:hypothetical protein